MTVNEQSDSFPKIDSGQIVPSIEGLPHFNFIERAVLRLTDLVIARQLADRKIKWGTEIPDANTTEIDEDITDSGANVGDDEGSDTGASVKISRRFGKTQMALAGIILAAGCTVTLNRFDNALESLQRLPDAELAVPTETLAPTTTTPRSPTTVKTPAPVTTPDTTIAPTTLKPSTTTSRPKPRTTTTTTSAAPIEGPASVTVVTEKAGVVMSPGPIYQEWIGKKPPLRFKFVKFGTAIMASTTEYKSCNMYIGLEQQTSSNNIEEVRTYKKAIDCGQPLTDYSKLASYEIINLPGLEQLK